MHYLLTIHCHFCRYRCRLCRETANCWKGVFMDHPVYTCRLHYKVAYVMVKMMKICSTDCSLPPNTKVRSQQMDSAYLLFLVETWNSCVIVINGFVLFAKFQFYLLPVCLLKNVTTMLSWNNLHQILADYSVSRKFAAWDSSLVAMWNTMQQFWLFAKATRGFSAAVDPF